MTDRLERERRTLQQVIAVAAIVPLAAGLYGVLFGAGLTGDRLSVTGDSHYRYLSGLLLGIGLVAASVVPAIETKAGRMQVITLIVVTGGLGRLAGVAMTGLPSLSMLGALVMELGVTPLVCLWQWRIARAYAEPIGAAPSREPVSSPEAISFAETVSSPTAASSQGDSTSRVDRSVSVP